MNIQIREAQENDFLTICELIKADLGYLQLNEAETLKRLAFFYADENWCTYVAEYEKKVVGFIGIMKGMAYNIVGYYSQIMALAVSNKIRRMGIGTLLIKEAEEWSLKQGITDIGVNSSLKRLEAHLFYERNGYCKKSFSFIKKLEE